MVLSFPVSICVVTKADIPNATAHMMPKHRATPMAFGNADASTPAAILEASSLLAGALKRRQIHHVRLCKLHPISSKMFNQYLVVRRVGEIWNLDILPLKEISCWRVGYFKPLWWWWKSLQHPWETRQKMGSPQPIPNQPNLPSGKLT